MSELPEKMTKLLKLLQKTNDQEIDCDAFWERAAELAEHGMSLKVDDVKIYLHHLDLCPGCAEEFSLLKNIDRR
jgi:hypothetical protein